MSKLRLLIIVGNLLTFSSLCLGQQERIGIHDPVRTQKTSLTYVRPKVKYAPMPISMRANFVPRMGFCSTRPADVFADALYGANGTIKAVIYGDPYAERIDFSHERLLIPRWKEPMEPPKIAHILPTVRKMLLEGRFTEVPGFVVAEITKDPLYDQRMRWAPDGETRWSIQGNSRSHTPFTMNIHSVPMDNVTDYLRVTDWTTGESRIHWTDERGAQVRRGFVSRPAQAACQLLTAPKGASLNCKISLSQLGGGRMWTEKDPVSLEAQIEKKNAYLIVKGHYDQTITKAGFASVVRVVLDGGNVTVEDGALCISGANKATILTMIEPLPFYNEEGVQALKAKAAALNADYEALLAEHAKTIGPQMEQSTVRLCSDYEALKSVEELLEEQISEVEVSVPLLEKLYHMGRFFLINDTGELPPAWGQYNINVNLQVCSGNITGLHEQMRVFFRFFESKFEDFRVNAQNIFGCRGIMASIHPSYDTGYLYHFSAPWPHFYWIACAGWVFNEYWGYYLTTGDEDFLREHIVPGLKEIALFFEDYLTDIGEDGRYLFYPGFSPENGQARGYPITINPMMDVMVCREVLCNLLTACEDLGITDSKEDKWRDMLSKLPTALLDDTGALREWAWDAIRDDLDHRHVSHHYDVWPGNAITWEETPELALAVLKSNRKRGQENDSAHGLMHRLFTAIRLKDTVHACGILKQLFEHGFVNRSLLTNHNPHRALCPDALGGLPSVLAEMAVYSKPGLIELLPAMPGLLAKGEITGLCLYTFAQLEHISWDLNENTMCARILPLKDQTITLRIRQGYEALTVDGVFQPSQRNNDITLCLKKDVPVDLIAKLRPKTNK